MKTWTPVAFLVVVACSLAVMVTAGLQQGRVRGDFYTAEKKKRPVSFWAIIVFGYGFAAALLLLAYHQWQRIE